MWWIMDTLWQNWKLDHLPAHEAKQRDSFPRHGVSSSTAPLSPTVWTELGWARLCQASFSSYTAREDLHSAASCTVPQLHVFFLQIHVRTTCPFIPFVFVCVQATGFQCVKLWLWAAVAGWPAEAVCWVGQCSSCRHLRLPQPPAGQICGNTDCWGAQLWYGEKKPKFPLSNVCWHLQPRDSHVFWWVWMIGVWGYFWCWSVLPLTVGVETGPVVSVETLRAATLTALSLLNRLLKPYC